MIDALKERFEHIELFGKPALFTNSRVDVSTIPLGFFCYNLRGSDRDPGRPISLEQYVGVNHAGAVLTPEKIEIPESGYRRLRGGMNFLGEAMTLSQFCEEHHIEYRPRFAIVPAAKESSADFFARMPEEDRMAGAIGHVRIDFGKDGDEFWHTWHPRGDEGLNSAAFKEELTQVVDQLRDSVLKNQGSMGRFCYDHGGSIDGGWRQNYGYTIETERYRYCLRCSPGQGDYHAYLSCFDKNVAMQNRQKGVLVQLAENKDKVQKESTRPTTKQKSKNEPNL